MGTDTAMKLRIDRIREQADRPEGYVDDVLSRGIVNGEWLEISSDALSELRNKYRPKKPEPHLPSFPQRAINLADQSRQELIAIAKGVEPITEEESARRLAVCKSNECGFWRESDGTCAQCGCPMVRKAPWRSAKCPIEKW